MPSAEEPTYLIEVDARVQEHHLMARDVDLLVSQIKENLRLSGLKAKSSISHKGMRPSPYSVPSRSWADTGNVASGPFEPRHKRAKSEAAAAAAAADVDDDPYELLQELLREGALIKEAVKRLQDDGELKGAEGGRGRPPHRRKQYFYDSEDEPLPQVFQTLDL